MDTTRLSSKGQVIIPKAVRDAHGWREGMEFTVEDVAGGGIVLRPSNKGLPKTTIDQVAGMLKYDGPPKTIEDMNAGVDEAIREMWSAFEAQSK
jgi:AbrB family looped-hinge helix DNA binding protein